MNSLLIKFVFSKSSWLVLFKYSNGKSTILILGVECFKKPKIIILRNMRVSAEEQPVCLNIFPLDSAPGTPRPTCFASSGPSPLSPGPPARLGWFPPFQCVHDWLSLSHYPKAACYLWFIFEEAKALRYKLCESLFYCSEEITTFYSNDFKNWNCALEFFECWRGLDNVYYFDFLVPALKYHTHFRRVASFMVKPDWDPFGGAFSEGISHFSLCSYFDAMLLTSAIDVMFSLVEISSLGSFFVVEFFPIENFSSSYSFLLLIFNERRICLVNFSYCVKFLL